MTRMIATMESKPHNARLWLTLCTWKVHEGQAFSTAFKPWDRLPMRMVAALRVRNLCGQILVMLCGSWAVSNRDIEVAAQALHLR